MGNPTYPSFPLKEFEKELERKQANYSVAIQEVLNKVLEELRSQNPQLIDGTVTNIHNLKLRVVLSEGKTKGILLTYLEQCRDIFLEHLFNQIEEAEKDIGRTITPEERNILLTIPSTEINTLDQFQKDNSEILKLIQNQLLTKIDELIPKKQTTRPAILICIYLTASSGSQLLAYIELNGKVLIDEILKPPTVTLDTDVIQACWRKEPNRVHTKKLLELAKLWEIDLAITRRIYDDIPDRPLADKINELPDLNINETGAVIRVGKWKVGVDMVGSDDFKKLINTLESSQKYQDMNKNKRPDWRDWDHIHSHYMYGRDYFLTWDSRLLHFKNEFHNELGITLMKPEEYLSQHQPIHLQILLEKCPDIDLSR